MPNDEKLALLANWHRCKAEAEMFGRSYRCELYRGHEAHSLLHFTYTGRIEMVQWPVAGWNGRTELPPIDFDTPTGDRMANAGRLRR